MSERVVVIEQPNYVPWLGYFGLMAQADLWVWYDDVQYTKRDWRSRNRVGRDQPLWLTVPIRSKGRYAQRICDVEIDDGRIWARKHLAALRHCYAGAPYFEEVHELLGSALARGHQRLSDLTIELNESLCRWLGLGTRFARSSCLEGVEGRKQGRLLEICRRLEATAYLSGPAARGYIDPRGFRDAGIELRYVVYDYPPYPRGSLPFVPRLSVLDALVWMGPAATAAYLARHARWEAGTDAELPAAGAAAFAADVEVRR